MATDNGSLRSNYTRKQFIALSQRQSDLDPLDSKYYYRLEMTEMVGDDCSYTCFKLGQTHIEEFPTFESAENYMRKYARQLNLYRSRITQFPLSLEVKIEARGTQWLYDREGNLVDCTIVQKYGTPEEIHFFGRPLNKQRFRPGDIAELVIDDEVRLVLILQPILTPEECWEIYREERSGYDLDFSTDCYSILKNDEGYRFFAITTALMAPRYPISPEMKAKLESRYDAMVKSAIKGTNPTVKMIPILDDNYEGNDSTDQQQSPYGDKNHGPYTLYQNEDGKWGLIDGSGNRLPAIFDRLNEYSFSCMPCEIMVFDETEGFALQAWYDPCETWFNFTYDEPASYPEEFDGYLWKESELPIGSYADILYSLLPDDQHWFAKAMIEIDFVYDICDEEEKDRWMRNLLTAHPEVTDFAMTTRMIEPILLDKENNPDFLCALWRVKVGLDYELRVVMMASE